MNEEQRKKLVNLVRSFTLSENKDAEIARLTVQNEQLTESNRQLREELERVKILALRIYPDLKASGICSAHSDDGHFDCETCYPNWKELAKAHCDLKQKAWTALAAAKEELEKVKSGRLDVAAAEVRLGLPTIRSHEARIAALTTALAAAKEALEYAQHRARLEYALTASEMPTIKTNYDNALALIAECKKD